MQDTNALTPSVKRKLRKKTTKKSMTVKDHRPS